MRAQATMADWSACAGRTGAAGVSCSGFVYCRRFFGRDDDVGEGESMRYLKLTIADPIDAQAIRRDPIADSDRSLGVRA